VLAVFRRPQAKAIVMFAGQDQPFHSRRRRGAHNLVSIEISWIEERRRLVTVAPFFVSEGVDGEMDESIELHFMPAELPRGRNRPVRLRWSNLRSDDRGRAAD